MCNKMTISAGQPHAQGNYTGIFNENKVPYWYHCNFDCVSFMHTKPIISITLKNTMSIIRKYITITKRWLLTCKNNWIPLIHIFNWTIVFQSKVTNTKIQNCWLFLPYKKSTIHCSGEEWRGEGGGGVVQMQWAVLQQWGESLNML